MEIPNLRNLFLQLFKEDVLSLDAGTADVRAVHYEVTPAGFEVKKAVSFPADHLEDSLRFHFPGVRKILLSIPDSGLFIRNLIIPAVQKSKIREILPFEAEGVLPVGLEETEVVSCISRIGDSESEVIGYGALHQVLRDRVSLLPETDEFSPVLLVPESAALAALLPPSEDETAQLVLQIHFGKTGTILNITESGRLVYTRSIPYGTEGIRSLAAEILKTDETEAESILAAADINIAEESPDLSLRPDGVTKKQFADLHKKIREYWSDLAAEAERTLLTADRGDPDILYLSGSWTEGAQEFLTEYFGIPSGMYDFSDHRIPNPSAFITAAGIFRHYRLNSADRTDFLSAPFGRTLRRGEFKPESLRYPGVLTAAGVLFLILAFFAGLIRDRSELASLKKAATEISSSIPGVNPNGDPVTEAKRICTERLSSHLNQTESASVLQIMKEISDRMPDSSVPFKLSSVRFDEKDVEIEAEMDRLTDVTNLENSLRESPVFSRTEVKSEARADRKVRVKINLIIKENKGSAGRDCS